MSAVKRARDVEYATSSKSMKVVENPASTKKRSRESDVSSLKPAKSPKSVSKRLSLSNKAEMEVVSTAEQRIRAAEWAKASLTPAAKKTSSSSSKPTSSSKLVTSKSKSKITVANHSNEATPVAELRPRRRSSTYVFIIHLIS